MTDIIYHSLPSHHFSNLEHGETFNSFLMQRLNSQTDKYEDYDEILIDRPIELFQDAD